MSESNDSPQAAPTMARDQLITHRCDWAETDPTLAVVEAIAVAANREPTDHRPLYDAVDTDALNDIFDGDQSPSVEVSFTYEGFDVSVAGTGTVTVRPADGGEFPA